MNSFRRLMLCLLLVAPLDCLAQETSFPNRPIHLVVPTVPGGGQDLISRIVADQMSKDWGQPVIVENRGSGNGIIGSDVVAKAKPDGYTFMIQSFQHATNPSLHKSLPYTLNDFTAISVVASQGLVVTFNPNIPAKTIQEFIALAKANPGKYNYASGGLGSSQHLFAELFIRTAGIDVVHVPYGGIAPGMTAVLTGDAAFMFNQISTSLPNIKAGKLRALAVTAKESSPLLPGVPTLDSSGLPGFEARTWFAMFGPANMPKPLVDKISGEVAQIMRMPAIKEKLAALGVDGVGNTPAQAQAFMEAESARWANYISQWSIKAE